MPNRRTRKRVKGGTTKFREYLYQVIYIMLSLTNLKKPIYTNNSLVFYKRGSLASGGVSTVANSRVKARRT